jgi:ABC-type polysaccharide/polyol phosphate transport system ATPase subunit
MPTGSDRWDPAAALPAVEVDELSVCYRLPRERVASFKEFAIRWLQRRVVYEEHWALSAVSLSVGRGEIFGVLGPNGVGKSTLLKTLARVLHPTSGRVVVRGTVAPILELGSGFHGELTGRENVYLYGALLGRDRLQVDEQFDSIVEFAGLSEFIDAPLRVYSSGMMARLGFAIATQSLADVFLIDEVLAVGDERFQARCLDRLRDYRDRGAAILFVSHALDTVASFCDRALWLSSGQVRALGEAGEVVRAFRAEAAGGGQVAAHNLRSTAA